MGLGLINLVPGCIGHSLCGQNMAVAYILEAEIETISPSDLVKTLEYIPELILSSADFLSWPQVQNKVL